MSLRQKAFSGILWTFAQKFSVQAINFGVQIVLARLLMPEMFGMIAMLQIFLTIGNVLVDGGMTSSLIRTTDAGTKDYSTVFYTNIVVSIGIYFFIFFISPYVADFYNLTELATILKVLSVVLIIQSLSAVQTTILTKEMKFKLQMKIQIPSLIVASVVGIYLAYNGFGVWSLVWMNICQATLYTLQIWIRSSWKPRLLFNKPLFKHHFSFGYKLTLSSLMDSVYNNAYNIVIGKLFSPALVGFYNQADNLRLFPVMQFSYALSKVTYPTFAKIQNDDQRLKSAYKRTMQVVFFIITPIMVVLIILAEPLFRFLFGEKWLPAVPYFQLLSIASIVRPVSTYNLNILKVKGRSDLFLRLEVIKKIIGVVAIAIAIPFGIMGLIWSNVIIAILSLFLNMFYSGRLISYYYYDQVKDLFAILIVGVATGLICWFLDKKLFNAAIEHDFFHLLLTTSVFLALYAALSYLFKIQAINYLAQLLIKRKNV